MTNLAALQLGLRLVRHELSAQGLANVTWALATLRQQPGRELAAVLLEATCAAMPAASPQVEGRVQGRGL